MCSPDYPCDMVTVLHVVLFKTSDPDHSTREKAMQLLQLLDARFLSESGYSRPELLSCLTGGTYSQSHIVFSKELATTNPELTIPLFNGGCVCVCACVCVWYVCVCVRVCVYVCMYVCMCVCVVVVVVVALTGPPGIPEMVYRFEMAPRSGQRNILQYMVPWLANVELLEENHNSPYISHASPGHTSWQHPSSAILRGTGWGSLDGTKLVLHNLLYITAKVTELQLSLCVSVSDCVIPT